MEILQESKEDIFEAGYAWSSDNKQIYVLDNIAQKCLVMDTALNTLQNEYLRSNGLIKLFSDNIHALIPYENSCQIYSLPNLKQKKSKELGEKICAIDISSNDK